MTDTIQPVLAVIFVLGLLGGVLHLLRRRGVASLTGFHKGGLTFGRPAPNAQQLNVVERVTLGPQHALHLVRVGDRLFLVGTAPGSCQLLDSGVKEVKAP